MNMRNELGLITSSALRNISFWRAQHARMALLHYPWGHLQRLYEKLIKMLTYTPQAQISTPILDDCEITMWTLLEFAGTEWHDW
jgi:hypothetical protein